MSMSDKQDSIKIFAGVLVVGGILMALLASGTCEVGNQDSSKDLLERQGYTDVRMTGYAPMACGRNDITSSGFEATSPNGSRVSGSVCCGALRGDTHRGLWPCQDDRPASSAHLYQGTGLGRNATLRPLKEGRIRA